MLDRRRFLIGAGGLLTASFVNQAKAFSRRSGQPLVLSPAKEPEETLYVYRRERSDYGGEWRVSLGQTSRLRRRPRPGVSICIPLGIPSKRKTTSSAPATSSTCLGKILTAVSTASGGRTEGQLRRPPGEAHHLLKDLDLGQAGSALRQAGQIIFEEFGDLQATPTHGSNCRMI